MTYLLYVVQHFGVIVIHIVKSIFDIKIFPEYYYVFVLSTSTTFRMTVVSLLRCVYRTASVPGNNHVPV